MDWATIMPLVTAGVSTAGQIAAARQQGRQAQAQAQVPVDRMNQDAATSTLGIQQRGLDAQDAARLARALGMLQEQRASLEAPGMNASNAVRGDILANAQDAEFSGPSRVPKFEFSGGLRPSMFSGNTRQLGSAMSRDALMSQLKGSATPFSDLPEADYSQILNAKPVPGATPLPEGSRMDSVLQAIGQYGGLAAGVYNGMNPPSTPAPTMPTAPSQTPLAQMPWGNVGAPQAPPRPVMAGGTGYQEFNPYGQRA